MGLGVEHGDANHLRGERPEAEQCGFPRVSSRGRLIGDFFGFAEKIFALGLVEIVERQRGSFDIENEPGHDG